MPSPIQVVQQRLGVHQSGQWDSTTDGAILAYQHRTGQYPMDAHGHPDPMTLVNLGYYAPADIFTPPWADYLAGGSKPGSFVRDIETAIDQVPRWAWITVAASFSLFSYMAWRGDRKRGQ
jgi:hypothetical protein